MPFYADIPNFLTYDRFQLHLFPLHVRLEKNGVTSHQFLWPLTGFGSDEEGQRYWHASCRSIRWRSTRGSTSATRRCGRSFRGAPRTPAPTTRCTGSSCFRSSAGKTSEKVHGWTFLWPFFSWVEIEDRSEKLDVLWPIYRRHTSSADDQLDQWWLWPLMGHTVTEDQDSWSVLWPLIWFRNYDDPDNHQEQDWFLPFYWRVHNERADGTSDGLTKIWPLFHNSSRPDGSGDYQLLSPWPWRRSYSDGVEETYGWLWTLAGGRYTENSSNFDLAAHVFSTAERDGDASTSVPFLFNYESDDDGAVLRLFQFLPIPLGGGSSEPDS